MNRLRGKFAEALSGIPIQTQSNLTSVQKAPESAVQSKIALVIGNSNYAKLPKLSNPNKRRSFHCRHASKNGLQHSIAIRRIRRRHQERNSKICQRVRKADVAVVFYAGHGAQLNGSNYLLPIDIDIPRHRSRHSVRWTESR